MSNVVSSSVLIGGNDREPVCFDDQERLGELQSPKVIKQRLLEVDNLSLEIICFKYLNRLFSACYSLLSIQHFN